MSTIGSDGLRRWAELGPGATPETLALRAAEMARALAAALQEANERAAQDAARVLTEAARLPVEAKQAFLSQAAGPSHSDSNARARAVREQVTRAFPEGSEARRSLGGALVSLAGDEPKALEASALEAKVEAALNRLGAVSSAAGRSPSDTMERARPSGIFGDSSAARAPFPSPAAEPGAGYRIHELASGLASVATGGSTVAALPESWQRVVGQAQAPGLTTSIASIARAASAVASAREGLAGLSTGGGVWARARKAAGDDALGRIAGRFEGLRERVGGGLQEAAILGGSVRAQSLAAMARDVRGEATALREDIAGTRELLPDADPGLAVSDPAVSLDRAEGGMRGAEYGLHAFATQQDLLSGEDLAREAPSSSLPTTRITDEELARIGTGITEAPPAQGFWNVGTVGAGMDPAFSCEESCRLSNAAVNTVIGDATSVRPLEGAELAAAIRDMGVPLEKVDPNQIGAALGYVNTGASGAVAEFGQGAPRTVDEQKERLTLALRQFRCLAEHGPAPMDRKTAIEVMWSAARIPGHAFEKMSDAEVRAAAQQTAAACNTPGQHEFKIGSHTVKLSIGESGTVLSTSTKAPSFWSRVGQVAKVALTVASFVPGPIGLAARGIQAGIALVNAVRNGGGFLNLVAAGASFVGAGAAAVSRFARAIPNVARIAGNVARVANSVAGAARGVQGIQQGGVGGILSGAAGIANGIAGGIEGTGVATTSPLGHFATDIGSIGRNLGRVGAAVGAAESYIHANRAVNDAREALQRAQAAGDPAQIRKAQEQLAAAEQGKRSAVFGGLATMGQVAADTYARDSSGQEKPRTDEVSVRGRSAFQMGAEMFSRGMSAARGVNEGDFLTAGVEAFGAAAAAHQGTRPVRQEMAMDGEGRPIPAFDKDGHVIPGQFQMRDDFALLNQTSSVLDGLSNWRQAERGETQAREAVNRAKEELGLAQASGNPEAIREAEANLNRARQGLVQAYLGSTAALQNASERFTGAIDTFNNSRAADRYRGEAPGDATVSDPASIPSSPESRPTETVEAEIEKIKKTLDETRDEIRRQLAIASDPNRDPQERLLAAKRAEQLGQAMSVLGQFLALPDQDPEKLRQGHATFLEHRGFVLTTNLDTRDLVGDTPSAVGAPGLGESSSSRSVADTAGIAVLSKTGTLSHIAAMTGISVERLQEFNARYGVDLGDTTHLPIGQRVLIPMGEVRPPQMTLPSPEEMLARQELGLPWNFQPGMRVGPDTDRSSPLFDDSDPGFFDEGRALADGVRDVVNERVAELTRSIVDSGRGGPIAFVGTLPLHVLDETVNFSAGFTQGVLNTAEGITTVARHPLDTTLGVASLIDRAAQTTPAGRTLEFLAEAAFGKYGTTEEALQAYRERMDPASLNSAQLGLVKDLTEAQFEHSLRLAREGRYSQAMGVLYGENIDLLVAGVTGRGGRLARLGEAAEDAEDLAHLRTLYGEGPESNAMRIVDGREAALKGGRQHHVFPQEPRLRMFFEERGFVGDRDIDKFCVELERSTHEAIHGGGDWRLGRREWEGEWNRRIVREVLDAESRAGHKLGFEEVMKIGLDLLEESGLPTEFVPYTRGR